MSCLVVESNAQEKSKAKPVSNQVAEKTTRSSVAGKVVRESNAGNSISSAETSAESKASAAEEAQSTPASLISFTAKHARVAVRLSWVTERERENQSFTVERSADGSNFSEVFSKTGAGNSNRIRHYFGEDKSPLSGLSYYRHKLTDSNGKISYSEIVPVRIKKESVLVFAINPQRQKSILEFDVNLPYPAKGIVRVTDAGGKILISSEFSSMPQIKHFSLNSSNLTAGTYFLKINFGNESLVKRFTY